MWKVSGCDTEDAQLRREYGLFSLAHRTWSA
jgi:hypothetical protein